MWRAAAVPLLLLIAAAPAGLPVPPMPPRHHAEILPIPPVPPMHARQAALARPAGPHLAAMPVLEPAPLPDRDKLAPPRQRLVPEIAPTVFWPLPDVSGDGFIPGSSHRTEIELPSAAAPGLKLSFPIN